jgi:hypothetical protein
MLDCKKGARSMANYIARNHQEEFVAAAKEEAGLAPMGSMETMECGNGTRCKPLDKAVQPCSHSRDACHWHQLQDGIPTPRIEGTGRQ